MISTTDFYRLSISKQDQNGNTLTHHYILPLDLNYEEHYVCFIKKLMEDRVVISNDHLRDIANLYANAIAEKMEELVPWQKK